jgi:hypothetical protein
MTSTGGAPSSGLGGERAEHSAGGGGGAVPDIGEPLLRYLRDITEDPDAVAVVIMPELIFSGPQRLLHNRRAALHQAAAVL